MGLFSNKDKQSKSGAAPAPPAPPAPPSPNAKKEISEPKPGVQNLSAPPMPGGNLDDIKNQVSSKPEFEPQQKSEQMPQAPPNPAPNAASSEPQQSAQEPHKNEDPDMSDSLFDFSELDLQAPTMSDNMEARAKEQHGQTQGHTQGSDTSSHFIHNDLKSHKISPNESYFVTTKQFKQLLEIIENVKNKVKEASETHLRLLDIKSEEDIEYENLRKDFQYVEDKLHEVDSIIFEN